MNIDEFRNALRTLLNEAARSRLPISEILRVADNELRPKLDDADMMGVLIRRYTMVE